MWWDGTQEKEMEEIEKMVMMIRQTEELVHEMEEQRAYRNRREEYHWTSN